MQAPVVHSGLLENKQLGGFDEQPKRTSRYLYHPTELH